MVNGNHEGRRRLTLVLCSLSGGLCAVLMAVLLIVYGVPYESYWWGVMVAILVAAFTAPRAFVPLIEWVIEGYRERGEREA